MKKSIYTNIRTYALVMTCVFAVVFVVVMTMEFFIIRQTMLEINNEFGDSAAEDAKEILIELSETDLQLLVEDKAALIDEQMQFITKNVERIEDNIGQLKRSAIDSVNDSFIRLMTIAGTIIIVFSVGILYLSGRLARRITEPIRQLAEEAAFIGEGNLDHIVEVRTGDELETLADAINTMIESVKRITAEKESIERENAEKARDSEERIRMLQKTEQERRTIQKSYQLLQQVLDILPVGIIIADRKDGEFLYVNRATLNLLDVGSFEEVAVGRTVYDFVPEFQPDGQKSADVITGDIWADDNGITEMECLKLNGETFWARIEHTLIDYEGADASLSAFEDMTAEKEKEQMLRVIADKEKEANQLKSRFLATVSHEIRTPMNAIIGMSELALRDKEAANKDEHIQTVKEASTYLLSIINDILDFSKIEAGKLEVTESDYSLASLLNDMVSIIRLRVIDAHLSFAVIVDSAIPHALCGDESRIRQCVLNLLSNAVKYTDKGFISFGVYGEFEDEDTVNIIFEITDSGRGIKQEDMDLLFGDFVRLEVDKNKSIEGAGLGLAIVKGTIEAMGGKIEVKSEYGAGSTFKITLPQKYHSRTPLAKVKEPEDKNVLVFEHRNVYEQSLVYTVKNLGVECDAAKTIEQFDEMTAKHKYSHIFVSNTLMKKYGKDIENHGAEITILTGFGESVTGKSRNRRLAMPAYCTAIAGVLNGTHDELSYKAESNETIGFSAPDAKVLIVDDIKTNLKVGQGLLMPYNMCVDLCQSGAAAIEAVQKAAASAEPYDLILMDHKMPGMDGVEATKNIRALADTAEGSDAAYFRDVPIIALTANVISGSTEMFLKNGFNDFLAKPINTVRLNTLLEKWIPKDKQK